jgi:hypothetical protein
MTITVADLIAQLATLPGNLPVILATDAEGNGFSPLAAADDALYVADNDFTGEWYATADMRAANPDDEWDEAPEDSVPALFLWPTS